MRFIFDCEDEICLPAAYRLVDDLKPYIEKMKTVEVDENKTKDRKHAFKLIIENMMVKFPGETGALLAKLWILDEGEKAPNSFKTLSTLITNNVALDFFTSALPFLLQISKDISPLLK